MIASLYVFLTSNSFHGTDHLLYYTYKHNTLYHTSAWHDHVHIHSALTQPLRPYSAHRHEGTYSHTSAYTPAHILFIWASHAASSISYTHTSMGALRFVTWNVNGAGSKEKKLKIFSQLKKLQADVVLLQETHRPATATDQLKTTEFPNVFTACYNSRQRGGSNFNT